jgi:hypothetical protein
VHASSAEQQVQLSVTYDEETSKNISPDACPLDKFEMLMDMIATPVQVL